MRKRRNLSGEETRLWATIARTARPLKGKVHPEDPTPEPLAAFPPPGTVPVFPPAAPAVPARGAYALAQPAPKPRTPLAPSLHPIERPVRRKIGKGRIALEDRVDLHGQTESSAHGTLLFFLRQAQARHLRHVLVITGRGASFGSTGTLKRALPHWFSTSEFRGLVAGYEPAERGHGGDGAFYVRMRRK